MTKKKLRNIAIIAHVDHGKTTLVDAMLKQTKTFAIHQKENQATTIMDSNDLEREKGVTILAKNTAVFWEDYKINILDTPGHADFSGEVERVLNMADGCILLVDAAEGVLSQTRFVLKLALELGLAPIVLINKVDRKDQRIYEVEKEIEDLFLELATKDSQLNYPLLYGRGIEGIVGKKVVETKDFSLNITDSTDLKPLFEAIIESVPAPTDDETAPLQIQVNSLDWDQHKGRIAIGRIFRGSVKKNQPVKLLRTNGKVEAASVVYLFNHFGLERVEVEEAEAGEIIAIAGMPEPGIGDTIADTHQPEALPQMTITEPTVKMQLMVNTSPFAGQESEFSTSRQLQARLKKELETNVGLRMLPGTSGENVIIVGRGELHLSILIETMRREGYEFALSKPQVVLKEENGRTMEPWEYTTIDVTEEYTGYVTSSMAQRRADMKNMHQTKTGVRFEYEVSTANLIGYRTELVTNTSGAGVIHNTFIEYRPLSDRAEFYRGGAMIAHETGSVTAYSLEKAQQRGKLLVDPGDKVYAGQVVGTNKRSDTMTINVVRGKKLTNMRASSADMTVVLAPAWKPSLEQFLTLIGKDEVLEVTPQSLRLRSMVENKKLAN
jgi:GTP-binding protein